MTRAAVLGLAIVIAMFLRPAEAAAGSPLAGQRLWVDPDSSAARDARALADTAARESALLQKIARRPQAVWLGDWVPDVRSYVGRITSLAARQRAVPVLVVYNIPLRDCGSHSAGGAGSAEAYRRWIDQVARGIGGRPAAVVLEPDALAGLDCLDEPRRRERYVLIAWATRRLERGARTSVYIDAGHSGWHSAATMARRLRRADVRRARGFALNVSNFRWTKSEIAYGRSISRRTGWKRFVIDTSRNGRGPAASGEWCNPADRALGPPPQTRRLPERRLDALLWVKRPGESDGTCNGGPAAGGWWREYALGLALRARWRG